MENLNPVLSLDVLKQKANEYAQKGAEEVIKEFYTGYNSPYKKAIQKDLETKGVDSNFDIPDIVAVLNEKFSAEVDAIANTAISKTFIPLVKDFLIRESSDVKFSDILNKFIEYADPSSDCDISDFEVNKVEDDNRSESLRDTFPTYQITNGKDGFELHFYRSSDKTVTLMLLPYRLSDSSRNRYSSLNYSTKETMKLSLDGGATLELPFTRGILENDFVRYCARLIMGNCNIALDVTEFSDDMFPEREW